MNNLACPTAENHILFQTRPKAGKTQIQIFLFMLSLKIRELCMSSAFACPLKLTQLRVNNPPCRPPAPGPSPLHARARRSQAAAMHPYSWSPLCPTPVLASQIASQFLKLVERGMLSCWYLYQPCGQPPIPTNALGSRPFLDHIAVSALRNLNIPDFWTCCMSISIHL